MPTRTSEQIERQAAQEYAQVLAQGSGRRVVQREKSLDELRKLHQKKHREEQGAYLVEGEHLVLELQRAAARDPRLGASELYVTHEFAPT